MPDLSVLIPVFKYDAGALIHDLLRQAQAANHQVEIIVFDDSAHVQDYHWHARFAGEARLKFMTHPHNQGRSKVRNQLLRQASAPWSLFLDGDMHIPEGFLEAYLERLGVQAVHCSGISTKLTSAESKSLRGKYSLAVEQKTANQRAKHPYRSFTAANFMLPTAWQREIQFPEVYTGYGHEDTHFGLQLMDAKKPLHHFDWPATHLGIDSDPVFVDKTRDSVASLVNMYRKDPLFSKYTNEIMLIKAWVLFRSSGLLFFVSPFVGMLEHGLKRGKFGLFALQLFKLACFERFYRANAPS